MVRKVFMGYFPTQVRNARYRSRRHRKREKEGGGWIWALIE